jgi:hypothetical protein
MTESVEKVLYTVHSVQYISDDVRVKGLFSDGAAALFAAVSMNYSTDMRRGET